MTGFGRLRPGLRGRLLLTLVLGLAVGLIALTTAFNLVLRERLHHDADVLLHDRASTQLGALDVQGGRLKVVDSPDQLGVDSQIWVFAGRRPLERPTASARTDAAARALARGRSRYHDIPGSYTRRLYSLPVVIGHRRVGTVVTAISLAPYERTANTALIGSILLGLVVLAAVLLSARYVISAALAPVAQMTSQASEWSERDLDGRFALGPPRDELGQLAATLDGLLDRIAAALRREQRFSAELSHELRTPLANVVAEAQLALRHERGAEDYRQGFEQILVSARQMSGLLESLMTAARAEIAPAHGTSDAYRSAMAAVAPAQGLAAERAVKVEVAPPTRPLRVGADAEVAERILAPLVENACRYGAGTVQVSMERSGGSIRYTVQDDGPGVSEDERERIFEPGQRGAAAGAAGNGAAGGAGLGLALSRRLARAARGDVRSEPAPAGARFVVRLPAA